VKNLQIFRCPSHPADRIGYAQNTFLTPIALKSALGDPNNYKYIATLAAINAPADRILLGEWAVSGDAQGYTSAGDIGPWYPYLYSGQWETLSAGQNGSLNFTFCDGHAKALKLRKTYSPFLWNAVDDWSLNPDGSLVAIDSNGLVDVTSQAAAESLWSQLWADLAAGGTIPDL
jgi:prepilin-type processing-associated H-X9-DG protein